ncbi:MAG: metal ABC transporter permease [Planctomycetota bacterium]|nr:MAG: metal ABC transporter permease [Planctomycetota bacterium]
MAQPLRRNRRRSAARAAHAAKSTLVEGHAMSDLLAVLTLPFIACLVLTGIHCYLGIHVVMRGVIFVDLALAQIAAMGAAVGTLAGFEPESTQTYACSLAFTMVGAAIFALGRFRDQRVPQEALIGITYAVASALTILVLSKSAVEIEEIENMLVGRLLFVEPHQIVKTALIYAGVGVVHLVFRKRFFAISRDAHSAMARGMSVRGWDFLFYATFGLVVTSSVQIAGVLLVFSYLVAPAVCAMMFFDSVAPRLILGWLLGMLGTVIGLSASLTVDLPPGVSVVAALGAIVLLSGVIYVALPRRGAATDALGPTDATAAYSSAGDGGTG